MVTRHAAVLALLLAAFAVAVPAVAQPLDWRRAGGPIFVGAAPAPGTPAPSGADTTNDQIPAADQPFDIAIRAAAEARGLDPKLLHALVVVETAYRPAAISPAGAAGLTQLMPATARDLGVADRFDVQQNLAGGAAYLARQVLRFGDLRLALAAYNSGPERVSRLGRVPAIAETRAYVDAVLDCYLALAAGRPVRSARECRPAGAGP